jgi:hypothetical protein
VPLLTTRVALVPLPRVPVRCVAATFCVAPVPLRWVETFWVRAFSASFLRASAAFLWGVRGGVGAQGGARRGGGGGGAPPGGGGGGAGEWGGSLSGGFTGGV